MSALNLSVSTGEISVTATPKTFLTLKAPANQRLKIRGLKFFGKSAVATDVPVKVELGLITTNGQTATATAITPPPIDGDLAETPQGSYFKNYGTEPTTYGTILDTLEVSPQTFLVLYFPEGQEIILKGGQELGLRLTATSTEVMSITAMVEE